MKHQQLPFSNLKAYFASLITVICLIPSLANAAAVSAPVDLATIPLANSPTVPIQSNLLFIFDDSGSMALKYMPDTSSSSDIRLAQNSAYNTIYYNPAVTYSPPVNFTSSGIDSTTYPSQTGLTTATGASAATKPNWIAVKNDAYGKVAAGVANITNTAVYATTLPGNATIPAEYCTKADLKNCATQAGPNAARPFFAPIRWCNSTANALAANPAVNACQATNMTGFTRLRTANARLAVITINSGGTSRLVSSIKVSGAELMFSSTSTNTNNATTIANEIADRINQCANDTAGNCTVAGYAASTSGATIYIFAPANSTTTATPVITQTGGSAGQAIAAFALAGNPTIAGTNNAPGQVVYSVIKTRASPATAPTFKYPGTNAKASTRTDCLGTTCTYLEEMTNFANWYTYYQTRAQMMKTSTSLAFRDIGDDFRVGFMTTSTQGPRSLNIARFDNAQKALWYAKLFDTVSDRNTPLRGALSKAGRIYAAKTSAGGVFTDPVQYECQQNFTLLTTDGFWNTADETATYAGTPLNVEGTATVGDLDAGTSVPLGMRQGTPAVSDTLADVAKYYRDTDLRTPALNNCAAGVCSTPSVTNPPPNEKQVMVTFTMGLGADGTLSYIPNYDSVAGDFADIKAGTKNWPNPIANAGPERIDDLWHAAVNGGGTYFSAKNPNDVVTQLKEALTLIRVKSGAGAAAATSTLNPVTGDNFAYVASYTSGLWAGNLERRTVSVTTGEVSRAATHCVEDVVPTDSCASPSTIVPNPAGGYYCKAPAIPDAASCEVAGVLVADCTKIDASCAGSLKLKVGEFTSTARNIKMNSGGSLTDFRYSNLNGTQKTYFDTAWLAANLTQWTTLTTNQKANATGTNLVNYLRGESGYTLTANTPDNRVFRSRRAVLGDLIDSKPTFVGAPPFGYSDPGYQTYKTAQAGRAKTVYVGSNDGMLHAFNADTLEERWAYVPSMVIPNMWKLADSNYSAKHAFYVDGDVIVSDVCTASCTTASATWKTILIGGLNAGGRGYYALDVTDPANPLFLWEFNASSTGGDVNMGYSFGNPIITKRSSDDKWVVIFTSGYNNIPDNNSFYSLSTTNFKPNNPALFTGGDGRGYLFVIDAATGNKLNTIPTNVGSTTVPSGLGDIKALRPDFQKNNTTQFVYGGDLFGNVWRFNLDTNVAFNFAQLQAGVAQPVTTSPELGIVKDKTVVIVGTGKYLEVSDLTNTDQQTLYAMKDDNAVTTLTNPRGSLAQQTIVPAGSDSRQSGSPNANSQPLVTGNGWYIDFPDSRERQNVASELVLGTLLVPTTVPESSACQPAGYGWFNYLDYRTGLAIRGNNANNIVAQRTTSPSVGFNVVYIDGKPKVSNVVADDENPKLLPDVPFDPSGTGFQLRRSIWREIETK